jgi:TerC family integral membrane protein
MHVPALLWPLFFALVLAMLALDLGVGRRQQLQSPTLRAAALWSLAWISVSLLFGLLILALFDVQAAVTYYTAYLLEKSLSLDNLFVFALIFGDLAIPRAYQRRVLLYGVVGALVMRALFIGSGVYLLDRFHWLVYPFAVLILLASVRLLFGEKQERQAVAAACAVCGSWVARFLPITPVLRDGNFWIRQNGRRLATPLLIALIVIETSDIGFSLDSIPAVLAVTREPFLVYTSNIFAMLGLRSLYFLLAGAVDRFHSLRYALGAILVFVGGKMLLTDVLEVPNWASLLVVITAVLVALAASALERRTVPSA